MRNRRSDVTAFRPAWFSRFRRDGRGVAIVEFAMVAPVLILFYVGMAELCQALLAERKAAHAASAIGDLVAQADKTNAADVQEVFNIAEVIMKPYTTGTKLRVRVSSVKVGDDNVARVKWSDSKGWTDRATNSVVTLPQVSSGGSTKAFLNKGESAVMSEVQYDYESGFSDLFVTVRAWFGGNAAEEGGYDFNSVHYLRPRKSEEVTYIS
jgi:Flp pilus assembly protein TadG